MRFLKLDLLTLLISLFLFASCENTSTIGLEVDPTSAVQGNLIDSLTISSRTVKDDDAATYVSGSGLTRYPLGFLNDPLLGTTTSSLAFSVNIPSESYDFGTNAVLDSAVLVLSYGGEFYGDSTVNYNIDVHQLKTPLYKETSFLSAKTYPYETPLVGNRTARAFPTTPFKVTDIVSGGPDTLKSVSPQIRIKLDPTFATTNVVALPSSSLKYNSYFQTAFKGLHVQIRPTTQSGMGKGGIMFFNLTNAESGLMLYYRKQNATTTTQTDTVAVNFPISTTSNPAAASIQHTYLSDIQDQLDRPNVQFTNTYIQPLAGLRTKLSFPYLSKFKTAIGKIVINKAELVIDLSAGSDVAPFRAAQRLALYRYDIAGQRKNLPDNNVGDGYYNAGDPRANSGAFGGYFDSVNKRYVFVITSYVQDLLDGKTEDYGTFLTSTPSSAFDYLSSFNTAARASIGSFKKIPATGDKLVKMNLYYTKIK